MRGWFKPTTLYLNININIEIFVISFELFFLIYENLVKLRKEHFKSFFLSNLLLLDILRVFTAYIFLKNCLFFIHNITL